MEDIIYGIIITLVLIIIIGAFLFSQKIETLKEDHHNFLFEALKSQQKRLQTDSNEKMACLNRSHRVKIENLEDDFLKKIRLLGNEKDNILTNHENNIPIMAFAVEPSINVRQRMPSVMKKEDKLYHNEGMVFSYSDHVELSYGKVYELLRTEVAKWLIDNQMVIGRYNRNSREVEFRLRYLNHNP